MATSFKLFVLPPLLALAVVAPALIWFLSYQSQCSMRTTVVFKNTRQSQAFALLGQADRAHLTVTP
jgi:hypothetical protein